MDDNFVWCVLIGALAYVFRDTLPSYRELTDWYDAKRLDSINDAVDDNEQTMLAIANRVDEMQSDVAGHLTRIDDLEARIAVVEGKAKGFVGDAS